VEVKSDEGNLQGGFIPVNRRLFNYFLRKYYSCPGVALLKGLKVAVTDVEMDVNILFETSYVFVVPSAKKYQLRN